MATSPQWKAIVSHFLGPTVPIFRLKIPDGEERAPNLELRLVDVAGRHGYNAILELAA